jgi:hypothetical protein
MWTLSFWKQVAERAVKGAAVAVVTSWSIGDGLMNAFDVNATEAAGLALGGALVSILLSLISAPIGEPGTPSLVATPAQPKG